jgi:hypothetical protein
VDKKTTQPFFQPIFGEAWDHLPTALKRHYANRMHCTDTVIVDGHLNIEAFGFGKILKLLFRLTGAMVPYEGRHIPTTVQFSTVENTNAFYFNRTFYFPGKKPYRFYSTMTSEGGNKVNETMGWGLVWRMYYLWDGAKVILQHRGYAVKILGYLISLPLHWLIGTGHAEETAISDDAFAMMVEIRHPWWGKLFGYHGTFTLVKDA